MSPTPSRKSPWRTASRTVHKWLALLVGLQLLLWVAGGVVFALVPFDAWVKSGEMVVKSAKPKGGDGIVPLARIATDFPQLQSLELLAQGRARYYRATQVDGKKFLIHAESGTRLGPIDEAAVRKLAGELYAGTGAIGGVARVDRVEHRWGLVDELHGRVPVWRVTYDDRFSTRLYFDLDSGEFLRARNDTWVLYDFFWRLHIMDYGGGEDFNNVFLRILAPLALILVASGAILLFFTRFRRAASGRKQ